ncbi:MAG: hypothetical protein ABI345_06375 [Jatrophihabitans sp.]
MTDTTQTILLIVFSVSSSIWVGGYVAVAVVARVATRALEPGQRVAFFRALGRSYLRLGAPALLVAFGTGAGLLRDHSWDGTLTAAVVVAAALLATLAFGVLQARRMTRLRAATLAAPDDKDAAEQVQRGARGAAVLRAGIGVLSLALVVLGSVLAT